VEAANKEATLKHAMGMSKPMKSEEPVAHLEAQLSSEQEAAENLILECLRALGGPTSVKEWFAENPDDIDKDEVLYHLVQEQAHIVAQSLKHLKVETQEQQRGHQKASIYLANMRKEEKATNLKVDHLLALYLVDVAEHVIVNFYKAVCVFVNLLRGCLNDLGWQKLADYKMVLDYRHKVPGTPFVERPPVFTATKGVEGCDMVF